MPDTEKDIEAVADAVERAYYANLNLTMWLLWQEVAKAAISAYRASREAQGWVEVPREDIDAIVDAAERYRALTAAVTGTVSPSDRAGK